MAYADPACRLLQICCSGTLKWTSKCAYKRDKKVSLLGFNWLVRRWISPYIRSFHSKALLWKGVLPQYWMLIFPLYPRNPISCDEVWATLGCAGREVGVGLVRVRMTFLWMSDTTSCYFSFEALLLIFCLFQLNVRLWKVSYALYYSLLMYFCREVTRLCFNEMTTFL